MSIIGGNINYSKHTSVEKSLMSMSFYTNKETTHVSPKSLLKNATFISKSCGIRLCPMSQMGGTPFGGLGAPNMEQMAAMGMPGPNMNPQVSSQ